MTRSAKIASLVDALSFPSVVVPVIMDEGIGYVAESIPTHIGAHEIPRVLDARWCALQGLSQRAGSTTVLRGTSTPNVVLVSVGSSYNNESAFRLAGASAVKLTSDHDVAFLLPTEAIENSEIQTQAVTEGALFASYDYRKDRTGVMFAVVPLGLPLPSVAEHDQAQRGLQAGAVIGEAFCWAKRLVDAPAAEANPERLASAFEKRLDRDPNVKVNVWSERKINQERLGGLLGVAQGSEQAPRLVYATYDPKAGPSAPHIALVGKGITFDAGGLAIKPLSGMVRMNTDMTGAAVVMAVISVAARLGLKVKITAITPLTENLPDGKALKPTDVVTLRNGKTMEILNPDAEGRIVLADGLSLAAEAKPDAIIDVATLTGAIKTSLGPEIGGLFSTSDELAEEVRQAGEGAGETFWRLPLHESYKKWTESDVADMKNMGAPSNMGGSIYAALILREFVGDIPWAHLDINGAATSDGAMGSLVGGQTPYGTRTLVRFLRALTK